MYKQTDKLVEYIEQVVEVLQAWANEQHTMFPHGPRYLFEFFLPNPKAAYKFYTVENTNLLGPIKASCSFSFERNSRKRISLWGRGDQLFKATAINYRNHILTNFPCGKREWLVKDFTDEPEIPWVQEDRLLQFPQILRWCTRQTLELILGMSLFSYVGSKFDN